MTTRRRPKKSLGNLLREEAQKDKDPEVEPLGTQEKPDPESSSRRSSQSQIPSESQSQVQSESQSQSESQTVSRSGTRSTTRTTTRRSKAAAQPEIASETVPEIAQAEADRKANPTEVAQPETVNPILDESPAASESPPPLDRTQPEETAVSEPDSPVKGTEPEVLFPLESPVIMNEPKVESGHPPIHLSPRTTMETSLQPLTQTSALTVLPRSANFQTLALPRAFTRPIIDRPAPWEIPHRPLVITGATTSFPSDLSNEDLGWFD